MTPIRMSANCAPVGELAIRNRRVCTNRHRRRISSRVLNMNSYSKDKIVTEAVFENWCRI